MKIKNNEDNDKRSRSTRLNTINTIYRQKSVDVIPIILRKRPDYVDDKSSGFRTPRIRIKSSMGCFDKSKTEGRQDKFYK